LPREEVVARVEGALEALGIQSLRDRAPYNLSEGEKKKVTLASILSLDPEVWLLDEPTANLDPRTRGWAIDFLLSLAERGKTLVVATHDLEIADIVARRAYVMGEDHRLAARGFPHEMSCCCAPTSSTSTVTSTPELSTAIPIATGGPTGIRLQRARKRRKDEPPGIFRPGRHRMG